MLRNFKQKQSWMNPFFSQFCLPRPPSVGRFSVFKGLPKLYIPSTLNIDLMLWHIQLIVCAENVKSWFKSWAFPFTFQAYTLPHTLSCICVSLFKVWVSFELFGALYMYISGKHQGKSNRLQGMAHCPILSRLEKHVNWPKALKTQYFYEGLKIELKAKYYIFLLC